MSLTLQLSCHCVIVHSFQNTTTEKKINVPFIHRSMTSKSMIFGSYKEVCLLYPQIVYLDPEAIRYSHTENTMIVTEALV